MPGSLEKYTTEINICAPAYFNFKGVISLWFYAAGASSFLNCGSDTFDEWFTTYQGTDSSHRLY